MHTLNMKELVAGEARGESFCLQAPLSLWDGIDSQTGTIIQVGHPDQGQSIAGKILVFSSGMSGATAGAAITETVRTGSAPATMVLPESDAIIVTASVTAGLLYDSYIPVYVTGPEDIKMIPNNTLCHISNKTLTWSQQKMQERKDQNKNRWELFF